VETERLQLREWRETDLDDATAMLTDPDVARYVETIADREDCWRSVIALQTGHWALRGYGWWVVTSRSDARFMGYCGLWKPEGWPAVELAWCLAKDYWGKGFALEAGRAAVAWAWQALDVPAIAGFIDPQNHQAKSAAAKLGFRSTGASTVIHGTVADVYRLERPGARAT